MNYLKVLFGAAMLLLAVATTSFANNKLPVQHDLITLAEEIEINSLEMIEYHVQYSKNGVAYGTCTIKVNGTLENGTTIEGTVEIEGISWFKCALIKINDIFDGSY